MNQGIRRRHVGAARAIRNDFTRRRAAAVLLTVLVPLVLFGLAPPSSATFLTYDLERPDRVRLEVFDLRGRRVRTLVADREYAGWHRVAWDGADERGQGLPSGIYFCRLDVGSWSRTMKLMKLH